MAYTSRLDFGPYGDFGTILIPTAKESIMPAAVAAPIIGAVGSLGGALIGSHQAGKAQKSQERANAAALQYQREQDMMGRQDFERAMRAYEANRNALLQRYGISVPQTQAPMDSGTASGVRMPAQPIRGVPGDLGGLIRGGGYTGRRPMPY